MSPEIVLTHRNESLQEDGMLFVRTETVFDTMVKVPLLVASMIIVAAVCQFSPHSVLLGHSI